MLLFVMLFICTRLVPCNSKRWHCHSCHWISSFLEYRFPLLYVHMLIYSIYIYNDVLSILRPVFLKPLSFRGEIWVCRCVYTLLYACSEILWWCTVLSSVCIAIIVSAVSLLLVASLSWYFEWLKYTLLNSWV